MLQYDMHFLNKSSVLSCLHCN